MTNVSVKAVRYVVYGTLPQKARTALRLPETAGAGSARFGQGEVPPGEAFGEASLEAIAAARKRIWILAFYISGGLDPTIDAFYNTLRDKPAPAWMSGSSRNSAKAHRLPIRNGTANFPSPTLLADGIQVGFIQEYRVMHPRR